MGHTTQLRVMASTLRMRTAISPEQGQRHGHAWTAVSVLLGPRGALPGGTPRGHSQGALPIMDYTGRHRPKGLEVYKRVGIL